MNRLTTVALSLAVPLHGFSIGTPRQSTTRTPPVHHSLHLLPLDERSSTSLSLLKGLVPSIDDDINAELAEASLSPLELFQRELSTTGSPIEAMKAVIKRQKDKSGDYENKFKILSDNRSYSNKVLLDKDHVDVAPSLSDLNQKQPRPIKVLWSRSYFRLFVFVAAFAIFPVMCNILNMLVKIDPEEFDIINEQFTPGIGILYGTFVALTLDILYERQGKVQENASVEASLLSLTTQNVLSLFRDEEMIAKEATQIIADQVRIIVYRSRGAEMLNIMRSDPYARLMSLVDRYQRSKKTFTPWEEAQIDCLRGEIPLLMEARARRLSDEASALPPTHFLVLSLLTALSLIGFTAATVSIRPNGDPPLEARMVFAGLAAIYVLFYNFSNDMNDPFDGVYQIKRSSAASYLLQIKWLVANQSWGRDIRFDTRATFVPEFDGDVLEVVGEDGKKSLGSTMKKMEDVESSITNVALQSPKFEQDKINTHSAINAPVGGAVVVPATLAQGPASINGPNENESHVSDDKKKVISSANSSFTSEDGITAFDQDTSTPKTSKASPPDNTSPVNINVQSNNIVVNRQKMEVNDSKESSTKNFLSDYFRVQSGFSEESAPSVSGPSRRVV